MNRSGQPIPFNENHTSYQLYQVDCWIHNKNPDDEDEFAKMMVEVKARAKRRLKAIEKKAKKYSCYAHHFS